MSIKDLILKLGGLKLSIGEATIPPYILLSGLAVMVIIVISKVI